MATKTTESGAPGFGWIEGKLGGERSWGFAGHLCGNFVGTKPSP